jgi:predicted Na+-dependent transporter
MSVDRLTNVLPEITLIEMMVTIGLGVTFSDVLRVSRNYGRVTRALLANCTVVPAAALDPLLLFHASPMIAVGFLGAAVCPHSGVSNRLCIVSDDCHRVSCFGVAQTYASGH